MSDQEFLPITKAAKSSGISLPTLRRLVNAGELRIFESRVNKRVRLVSAADLAALRVPQEKARLVA